MMIMPYGTKSDGRLEAFQEAIDQRLGQNFDKVKRDKLLMIQIGSFDPQDRLAEAFNLGKVSPDTYFVEFAKHYMNTLQAFSEVLGEQDFIKLFDVTIENAPFLIDPDAFARAHGLDTPPKLPKDFRSKG